MSDASGNRAVTQRTVWIVGTPSIACLLAVSISTQPVTGSPRAGFGAMINPNGLLTTARFEYGLTIDYPGLSTWTSIPAGFTSSVAKANTFGLVPDLTYHWRVLAMNALGTTYSADQLFTAPLIFPAGDLNGDGRVSEAELEQILTNY